MAEERIQKIMAEQGLCSRRAAEQIIAEGRVKVNGHPVKVGDKMDPNRDVLHVDDERIYIRKDQQMYYLALYKPRGYVTTANDELGRKTVMELVSDIPARLYPVGRLDKDSEGLLLMTNDGDFANRLMHPSHQVDKCYHTWVKGEDMGWAVELLRCPMEIDGYVTSPAQVDILELKGEEALLGITIHEGRNRQVRKMCEAAGLKVTRLMRVSEGGVELGTLKSGRWRRLTEEELNMLLE